MRIIRPPDFIIGDPERPYMLRWYVIPRNRWFNIYLHKIVRSDDDRALHDHPWKSLSLLLSGSYVEQTPTARRQYSAPRIIYRSELYPHRLEVGKGQHVWTLFITGPKLREWGFYCPNGWIPWTIFCMPTDHGRVGRGCGEVQTDNTIQKIGG